MIITSQKEIPDAPFYVTTTDKFMSGWGMAKGLTNRLIFVCESLDEAETVNKNCMNRSDQKNVRVCTAKPRLKSEGFLYQVKDKENSETWYQPCAFCHIR